MGLFSSKSSSKQYQTTIADESYRQLAGQDYAQITAPSATSSGANSRVLEGGLFSVGDDVLGDIDARVEVTDFDSVNKAFEFATQNANNSAETMGDILDWVRDSKVNDSEMLSNYRSTLYNMADNAMDRTANAYQTAEQKETPYSSLWYFGLAIAGIILFKKVKL